MFKIFERKKPYEKSSKGCLITQRVKYNVSKITSIVWHKTKHLGKSPAAHPQCMWDLGYDQLAVWSRKGNAKPRS
jgi:hypothetical protein